MRVLSRADLERLLTPADLIAAIEAAFRAHAAGASRVPARTSVETADGVLLLMPAAADAPGASALGAKLVSVFPGNRARGHPTLYATYVLMDATTGAPLALLDGTVLTALRTGATSALAARYLARPESRRLVCFGAGVQAAAQVRCLAAVLPIAHVAVAGRDPARAAAFARALRTNLGLAVELASDPRAAVREADVVTCATTSTTPVVFGADLRAGTHLDLVGAFRPEDREADTEAIRRARLVVDTYAGALAGAGDVLLPMREGAIDRAHVTAELAELVTGARAGRRAPDEITAFKSVGFALEDLTAARLAYNRAVSSHVGTEVEL